MTKEQVRAKIEAHNVSVDNYIANALPGELEKAGFVVKNGKTSVNAWFKAQELIKEQRFYERACELTTQLREQGFDVKRGCDHKLVWYGGMI